MLSRSTIWWPAILLSVVILPLLPSLAVIAAGFMLPGTIPWSVANAAITIGAIFSVCASGFLLLYRPWPLLARVLPFSFIVLFMAGFSQFEFFTSQECVTQQGKYIDLQRQYREINAAKGKSCGE